MEIRITVQGRVARLPDFLPRRGWSLHTKGYLIYTSRRRHPWIRRGEFAHRAVIYYLLGCVSLDPAYHVHHQNFDKLNCLPDNLLYATACFNPSTALRDKVTGHYISVQQFLARYGRGRLSKDFHCSWVTA